MAIQITSISTIADIYNTLQLTVPNVFASVEYNDESSPTAVLCKDENGNTILEAKISDPVFYFLDGTSYTVSNFTLSQVAACANGACLYRNSNGYVYVAKDAWGNIALCNTNGSNYAFTVFAPETSSASKQCSYGGMSDNQTILAHVAIPKSANEYNYFPKLYGRVNYQFDLTVPQPVTIGDQSYLMTCALYLQDE